jgi:hypothetical protein
MKIFLDDYVLEIDRPESGTNIRVGFANQGEIEWVEIIENYNISWVWKNNKVAENSKLPVGCYFNKRRKYESE